MDEAGALVRLDDESDVVIETDRDKDNTYLQVF